MKEKEPPQSVKTHRKSLRLYLVYIYYWNICSLKWEIALYSKKAVGSWTFSFNHQLLLLKSRISFLCDFKHLKLSRNNNNFEVHLIQLKRMQASSVVLKILILRSSFSVFALFISLRCIILNPLHWSFMVASHYFVLVARFNFFLQQIFIPSIFLSFEFFFSMTSVVCNKFTSQISHDNIYKYEKGSSLKWNHFKPKNTQSKCIKLLKTN